MVASRWAQRLPFLAAAISRSTSRPVRYSRVRTEEFKWLVPTGRPCVFSRYLAHAGRGAPQRGASLEEVSDTAKEPSQGRGDGAGRRPSGAPVHPIISFTAKLPNARASERGATRIPR